MEHVIHFILTGALAACGKRALSGNTAHAKFATNKPAEVTCKACARKCAHLIGR